MNRNQHGEKQVPRQDLAGDVFGFHRRLGQAAVPFVAAALPAVAVAAGAGVAAVAAVKAVRRWRNYRPPRNPGLKGWLRENCREINYVTTMSYRKLAQTTCQAIGLPEFLPLEWVMPGTGAEDATRELDPEHKAGMKLKR